MSHHHLVRGSVRAKNMILSCRPGSVPSVISCSTAWIPLSMTPGNQTVKHLFDLTGRVAVITGGAGLLGRQHAEAISRAGGMPALVDLPAAQPIVTAASLEKQWQTSVAGFEADITDPDQIEALKDELLARFGR